MNKFTHIGVLIPANATVPETYRGRKQLRETARYWITPNGTKYKKSTGMPVGQKWPGIMLDLKSIKLIAPAQN